MNFGSRVEIQLSGTLQVYKQNHGIDMNITETKWIAFYHILIEVTEITYWFERGKLYKHKCLP